MTGSASTSPPRPAKVRWRHSIFFRVVLLCGVLLFCLLGSVGALMRYFFVEAIAEMEAQAARIEQTINDRLEQDPDLDDAALAGEIMQMYDEYVIEFSPNPDRRSESTYHFERQPGGGLTRVSEVPIEIESRPMIMSLRHATAAQVEVLRAFGNRYLLTLIIGFIVTLGLMVYFIAKALRPLTTLSDSCAAISAGTLQPVATRGATGEILALEQTFNDMVNALQAKERVEANLRQAQRLSALGNLAAGIAHDVRNPLNAIKLLSSHAIDALGPQAESPALKPLNTIRQEVDRLENIVSNFLSLARETVLAPVPCQVDTLVGECLRLFQRDAEERGVKLTADLRAGVTLMLDPRQVTRAILNVLLNALEATPAGGRVRIFSRVNDRACEIEIRDDGPGLSSAELQRIFEPYYTTKPGGTGLGLAITRGIVAEHGGSISLTSSDGHGCQALFSFPLSQDGTRR